MQRRKYCRGNLLCPYEAYRYDLRYVENALYLKDAIVAKFSLDGYFYIIFKLNSIAVAMLDLMKFIAHELLDELRNAGWKSMQNNNPAMCLRRVIVLSYFLIYANCVITSKIIIICSDAVYRVTDIIF